MTKLTRGAILSNFSLKYPIHKLSQINLMMAP